MSKYFVKTPESFSYIPETLYEKYTLDQVKEMGLRDDEWISRSVSYSDECKESVVDESLKLLENKLRGTTVLSK